MVVLYFVKIILIASIIWMLLEFYKSLRKQFKRRKMKPIIKFNGGYGAILCHRCSVIIKENLTKEEFEGKTDLFYCDKCLEKMRAKKK